MAYNRTYQYETSPRKLQPEYEPIKKEYPKKSTARRTSRKEQAKLTKAMYKKMVCYIVIGFIGLFIISYRYSMIDDTHGELTKKRAELLAVEKETLQLEANLESNLNLTKIEEEATNLLGMKKLSAEQTVYVTLPKTDHVEVSSEEIKSSKNSDNWFLSIIDKIVKSFQ